MVTTFAGEQGSWLIGQETVHVSVTMDMTAMNFRRRVRSCQP